MQFKDYYQILGVPPGADADVIKTAYRKLARKFHPDVSKEKNAEERFKDINEAYEVLRDAAKRKAYDGLRARGYRPGEEFRPPPNFGEEFDVDFGEIFGNRGGAGGAGFSDFFESLFGRARAGGGPAPGGRPRSHDVHAKLEVDLDLAYRGGSQRIALDGRTLDVKIPVGVQPAQQIRLRGQGPNGADVMLEIVFRPHRLYAVEGRNLTLKLPVTPWEAALGATVEVPTLGGSVDLKIPPGTVNGRRLRLKGRGLPGPEPGDQYVVIDVQAPVPNTDEQREAYEKLREAFPDFTPRKDL
jgi:curved DNA-binding protein